jgi:hypothetical protein
MFRSMLASLYKLKNDESPCPATNNISVCGTHLDLQTSIRCISLELDGAMKCADETRKAGDTQGAISQYTRVINCANTIRSIRPDACILGVRDNWVSRYIIYPSVQMTAPYCRTSALECDMTYTPGSREPLIGPPSPPT